MRDTCAGVSTCVRFVFTVPPRSNKLDSSFAVAVGGKRRPRVDKARELFASGTKSLKAIRDALIAEFGIGDGVAKMDVADMVREMAAEQMELRPHQKTLALANCEAVFHAAMQAGKLAQAVRALELHAKIAGILQVEAQPAPEKPKLDFNALSPEERTQFRGQLDRVAQAQIAAVRSETAQA